MGTVLIEAGAVEGATGWILAKSYLPPDPDKVVLLVETGGAPPGTRITADFPTFQVRVRGEPHGYEEARTKLGEIQGVLHKAQGVLGGAYFVFVLAATGPLDLGIDRQTNRPEIAQNYRAMRSR
ncbi:MAG: minor capsid protein [Pseudarthrobacter sp.]